MTYSPFPPVFAAPGAGVPADTLQVGGSDGTDIRSLLTDTSGRILIQQPDQVLQATVAVTPAATAVTKTNTATVNGLGVAVTIANTDTAPYTANVCVKVVNSTSGMEAHWQSCGLVSNGSSVTLYFNLPVAIGDSIVVSIISPSTQASTKTNLTAVVTALPMAVNLRPDGRGAPLGSQFGFYGNNGSGVATTIQAAVGASWRILVKWATILSQGATGNGEIYLYDGTTQWVIVQATGAAGFSLAPPDGILSLPNASITGYNFTNTVYSSGQIMYDIVPL